MAEDVFKPAGQLQASKPEAGGAPVRNVPVFGIVKDNIDPNRSGRIFVYISDNSGKNPDERDSWTPVSLLTPFYGRTTPSSQSTGYGQYISNPSSYGEWHSPPDIGTTVICFFVNGDMNYGFYVGAIPDPEALQMVPAIGATENIIANEGESVGYGGSVRLPVTNINTNNAGIADSPLYLDEAKPVHSYAAAIYNQQGLIRDPVRGPISSSAQRESPSRVGWGVSTPGRPIYEGGYDDETIAESINNTTTTPTSLKVIARRGGHTFVMDDGDTIGRDQLVRIRTALGHQLLMSDDGQTFFIIHSNGQSYIELGKEGTVDIYSTNSINLRTQGDLNLHSDRNININAAKNLNIKGENITVDSDLEYSHRIGGNYQLHSLGKMTTKVDQAMSFESGSDSSFASKAITYINGSKINLNTGATGTIPQAVDPITIQAHTDTLYDSSVGFLAAPGKLLSIVSRAPAHAPWANAGQGVDVKTNLDASSNLPDRPAPTIENVNAQASQVNGTDISVAQTNTMPLTEPISESIDTNSTGAMLGAMAKDAATGPAKDVITKGVAVVNDNNVQSLKLGSFAQSPKQLEIGGVLKPGSSTLINSLVNKGTPVQQIMSNNLFTGKPGAESLGQYLTNTTSQAGVQVANLRQSQISLSRSGLITGKEAPNQLAGLVMSGVSQGLKQTKQVVQQIGAITSLAGVANKNSTSGVLKAITTGNNAINTVQSVSGAFGAITKSINALGQAQGASQVLQAARGIASGAFGAIRSTMKPLTPGVPQNLKAIKKVNEAFTSVTGALNTATNLNKLVQTATSSTAGAASVGAAIASGISNLPGGSKSISAVINKAANATNRLPGLSPLNGVVQGAIGRAFGNKQGVSVPAGPNGLLNAALAGLGPGPASQLTAAISALSSAGSQQIKLPTVGFNTTDRVGITLQTSGLLGNPRIPTPKLTGEISDASVSELDKTKALLDQQKSDIKKLNDFSARIKAAKQEYENLRATLPAGDPQILAARDKWFAIVDDPERQAILKRIG